MKKILNGIFGRMKIVRELMRFLWENKMWWMMPIIIVLVLLGVLILFTANNPAAVPFVYTLF
ncbi:MAG: hypothetical protein KJ893_07740 [Candidatus Omnitrophica bacterium]|nr:hypothetical protein [Candidatus Omnitrophota bacterium]MBU4478089.1 hypothetical protein [Candidatus Omnitrophota bacterium]MCG2704157.1 DUF5989 family protein [Candidatus Omnitrophota bacterium]